MNRWTGRMGLNLRSPPWESNPIRYICVAARPRPERVLVSGKSGKPLPGARGTLWAPRRGPAILTTFPKSSDLSPGCIHLPATAGKDQRHYNDGQIELTESDNRSHVSGFLSTWSRSLPKGRLCYIYRAFWAWKRLNQWVLSERPNVRGAKSTSVPVSRLEREWSRSPWQRPKIGGHPGNRQTPSEPAPFPADSQARSLP